MVHAILILWTVLRVLGCLTAFHFPVYNRHISGISKNCRENATHPESIVSYQYTASNLKEPGHVPAHDRARLFYIFSIYIFQFASVFQFAFPSLFVAFNLYFLFLFPFSWSFLNMLFTAAVLQRALQTPTVPAVRSGQADGLFGRGHFFRH